MNFYPHVELSVLVVDDHPPSRRFTVAALRQTGCSVKQATGVREAADRLRERWPGAIVCDWNLPDGNGADVVALVAALRPAAAPSPRLILQSGECPDDAARQGFECILRKPCTADALIAALGVEPVFPVNEGAGTNRKLQLDIKDELRKRLPQLEHLLLDKRLSEASGITHQLVTSAAFAGDVSLQRALGALHGALSEGAGAATVATRWCVATAAVDEFLRDS